MDAGTEVGKDWRYAHTFGLPNKRQFVWYESTSSDGKRIPQDSTGNAEQPHLPVFQCNGDSTVYDATLSTIDFMPPLWPKV